MDQDDQQRWWSLHLGNRFENLIADVANACYDRARGRKLGGRISNGVFDFGDDSILGQREFRVTVPGRQD